MKLYAIYFPAAEAYYVGHEEGQGKTLKTISIDKDLNCVVGIGKEKNARALASYITAFSGNDTEVHSFERSSTFCDKIATFQVPEEEIPDEEGVEGDTRSEDAA
jgi:hypothetical protein